MTDRETPAQVSEPKINSISDAYLERLPPLLTVDQAIGLTQLGRSTIYQAIRSGDLPSIRIGRRVLIPKASLLRRLGLTETE